MSELARLIRLGGDYERADQERDYPRKVTISAAIMDTADRLTEDAAWWQLVIRGRNIIRRQRHMEELHV